MDIADYLGQNLRSLRKRVAGTQEAWADRTGISQEWWSRLERGQGWSTLQKIVDGITRAGADPMDLFISPTAEQARNDQERELLALFRVTPPAAQHGVMFMLRGLRDQARAPEPAEPLPEATPAVSEPRARAGR